MRKNSGQSVTELAVFGVILISVAASLVNSVLHNNYAQSLNMKAYRMALKKSTEDANIYNHGLGVTYILIEDKGSPEVTNRFGFVERTPVVASGSVTRSNDFSTLPTSISEADSYFTPKVFIKVNDKAEQEFTSAKAKAVTYNTGWRKAVGLNGQTPCWAWRYITIGYDDGDVKLYYKDEDDEDEEFKAGNSADVDGDGEEEKVLILSASAGTAVVMDFQDGEIDFTRDVDKQGYLGEFDSTLSYGTASDPTLIVRKKNGSSFSVQKIPNVSQRLVHYISTRDDPKAVLDVSDY